jgi:exodeoxyribonuclease VII large subunit
MDDLPLFQQSNKESDPAEQVPAARAAWTVSETNNRIKGAIDPQFKDVWVQGEVSNWRPSPAGHVYFSLKDADSQLSATLFHWNSPNRKARAKFEVKDGMQLLCKGKVSVYAPRGSYQLNVDSIEPMGAGALAIAFDQLKAKLQSEGLFDPSKRRALPKFPRRVAVVTSASTAALRDVLNVLNRRAPFVEVTIVPTMVQGDQAPRQIIKALNLANQADAGEVILLVRGGGSIEDLWCFNDEELARAIRASRLPVISGVGHEIDFTIADFVSDLRAPTPSAAAEIVTTHWADVSRRLSDSFERIRLTTVRELQAKKILLTHLQARIVSPRDRLREQSQKCDELAMRLSRAIEGRLERRRMALEQAAGKLDALSPLKVLDRGYALTKAPDGRVLRSSKSVAKGDLISVVWSDGGVSARVE